MNKFTFAVTEKGVLKPAQAKAAKESVANQFAKMGFVATPRGAMVLEIGQTEDGRPVFAKVELAISASDVFAAPKAKGAKEVAEAVVIDLFD